MSNVKIPSGVSTEMATVTLDGGNLTLENVLEVAEGRARVNN
jgi:hypothetical protein